MKIDVHLQRRQQSQVILWIEEFIFNQPTIYFDVAKKGKWINWLLFIS